MVYRAEVGLYSVDGLTWTISDAYYVTDDHPTVETVGRLQLENLERVEGLLKYGDVLIKRQSPVNE
jgi:hypothetical protein